MDRKRFLAALAALPFVGKLVPDEPVKWTPLRLPDETITHEEVEAAAGEWGTCSACGGPLSMVQDALWVPGGVGRTSSYLPEPSGPSFATICLPCEGGGPEV